MSVEVIMPKAGVAMEEGTIVSWLKQEGEEVKIGEPILEITTDKVNMEIESEGEGTLAVIIHKEEGEVLPVFTVIGVIAEKGENQEEVKAKYLSGNVSKEDTVKENQNIEVKEEKINKKECNHDYDVVVIGGGPGGYLSALKAALLGGRVALVEENILGGTCLNRGCIPTKTYIKTAEILEEIDQLSKRGVKVTVDKEQDIKKAIKYKNRVVKKLTAGVGGLLKSRDVDVFNLKASVKEEHKVILSDGKVLDTENIIIATGSKVRILPIKGIESNLIITSTEALDLETVPEKLVIIGGGVIGCEFAEIFNSRGSKVTIVEMEDRVIPRMDKELSESLKYSLSKKGINVLTKKKVSEFKEEGNNILVCIEGEEPIKADLCLYAIGREANLSGIEDLDIKIDKGSIVVNSKMETSIPSIYAVGDVTGGVMLAHAAFKMGEVAASNALGVNKEVDLGALPSCVYTIPEVASVGITEEDARKKYNVKVGKFNFAGNGRALASGQEQGYVKVVADAKYGEILGIHMFGCGVAELINHAASFKALEIPTDEASELIFGHPCTSEALMEALADVNGECLHLPKK
ncbi:TPA: dihydrolipoyl dehydrogenase [Clostridioides difficile]|uniref:E3 component of acetoin dehydrogenase enzyme system (Dihydrolipoyl dehydrogenase) n=1 Tax=Clostridioides difficile ATCC 9689 = DSM 1296 TaxID=1121308 RepID=A0AC59FUK1_CLODI|nr:dihydrolipoyl dehydrogenase [Clostridioides difficile]AKP41050.1 E3 component of acetoin dehydrogenase enzyme system (dihydrolipoyl dehydrogenase) [Clostridioides difficile ATCC 9689 = DSM 1296]ARC15256.1 dihydrolipoyl dehydrogenase [Clostridioides difficile]AVI14164.1 dihydrolipoyl dehydrogenase [Clostridioides difficile]AXU85010.1 E3 component of acetoin dehydrogenase enzyme system (dihydrolipoyl dehydrogenase) [Clostridioides difficile]EGT3643131.1 dihydrolipoyl dehydrogenase [Clostridio